MRSEGWKELWRGSADDALAAKVPGGSGVKNLMRQSFFFLC